MYNEFDEYEDYSPSLQAAQLKRQFGRDILAECDNFLVNLNRKAAITKTSPNKIVSRMFAQAPHAVAYLRDYAVKRGLQPGNNLRDLATQYAYLRGEHIDEIVDKYDADNFGFGTAKGKAKRQAKRATRKAKRAAKKTKTEPVIGEEDTASTANINETTDRETAAADETQYKETPRAEQEEDLVNPTESDAHAEIIGEEFMGEGYDKKQAENMAPYIAGGLQLGNALLKAAKSKGGLDLKKAGDLLKREGQEQVSLYKKKETGNTLRENAPVIAVAVLALIFVGASMTSN